MTNEPLPGSAPKLVAPVKVATPAPAAAQSTEEVGTEAILARVLAGGDVTQVGLMALVNLLMAKEKRLLQKEAELAQRDKDTDEQARANCQQFTAAKIETQRNCKHLKGGKNRQRGNQKDFNVFSHRFANGIVMIKCNDCKMKWYPGDTRDFLKRNGMTIPNWTELGWRDAVLMCEESSNRPSASELATTSEGYFDPVTGQKIRSTGSDNDAAKKALSVPNISI